MYISLFFSTLLITNLGKNTMNQHNLMDRIFCNTLDLQHKFQIWFSVGSTFLFHQQGKKQFWFVEALSFCQEMKNIYFLFSFFHSSGNLTNRIVWTLLTEVVIFVVTIVLAMVDSSEWSGIFFYLTIGSVIILNSMFFYIVMRYYLWYYYYFKKSNHNKKNFLLLLFQSYCHFLN